jgi:hypothetical protein
MARQATTRPEHAPMLFAFRGVQMFQVSITVAALSTGVGATFLVRAFTQGATPLVLILAIILGILFLCMFGAALKAPTSLIAITEERSRIRFANFVDTVIATADVNGARLVKRNILGGIGVRTNFAGDVALVTTWGPCVELTLTRPVRIWLIPKILPVKATRLTLSVRNPSKLVERFGPPAAPAISAPRATRKMKQRGS